MLDKLLYTAEETAEVTGLSRAKVYALIRAGEIPSVKIDASRRVPVDALREWVDQKRADGRE